MNFRVPTCMKLLHPICSIKSSRERSKIIWFHGLKNYLCIFITAKKRRSNKFLMILIIGELSAYFEEYWNSSIFSIAIVPPFAGLRRFPEGRGFKQWTGDDSKALMKVSEGPGILN